MPVISALKRLRQVDCKFKASLGYIVRPCLKKKKKKSKNSFVRKPAGVENKDCVPGTMKLIEHK
jgi:hypothetical protein